MRLQNVFVLFLLLFMVEGAKSYVMQNNSLDLYYFHTLLLNSYPYSNLSCNTDWDCSNHSAICSLETKKCICPPYFELNEEGFCSNCPGHNEYCGYENCCGGENLVCYYGVCKVCLMDPISLKCITREQLMYSTLSQISLALAMILGILALITLLYKACKKPSSLFGSQRLTGNRNGIRTIEDLTRASMTSTQRRVLRDRPPRYERQQSTVAIARNPPTTPVHVIGEPPPLYSETENNTLEHRLDPPPAYAESFPTISIENIVNRWKSATNETVIKDEVQPSPGTSTENLKENPSLSVTSNQEGNDK